LDVDGSIYQNGVLESIGNANNYIDFTLEGMTITAVGDLHLEQTGNLIIPTGAKIYVPGSTTTYISPTTAGRIDIVAGSTGIIMRGDTTPKRTTFQPLLANTSQAVTVADNAGGTPATATISPTTSFIQITCNDTDGCTMTMTETGMGSGDYILITNLSANVATFADTSGVTELAGAFSMGQYDSLSLRYATDRWVEVGRSDN
jgi:hypothetical protein